MKKVILAFFVFQISILFVGCSAVDNVASGFVIAALIIGGPLMLLLLFGNIKLPKSELDTRN